MLLPKEIRKLITWDYRFLLPREWRNEIGFSPSDDDDDDDDDEAGDGDELQERMWSFVWMIYARELNKKKKKERGVCRRRRRGGGGSMASS